MTCQKPCIHRMDFPKGLFVGGLAGFAWASIWAWICFGGGK
jgi:hypothetical protein